MKCLLVIDMQKISFSPLTPRYNADLVCANINRLSAHFRKNNDPMIFIQHNGINQNICIPGSAEWEILDELDMHESDVIVEKKHNDSFCKSGLEQTLKSLDVTELFITGCATDFCVNSTLQTAFAKGYKCTVVADGHTTADRPGIAAGDAIDYFHYIWNDMYPVNGKIEIKTADSIIST